jgi:hypothetical protein
MLHAVYKLSVICAVLAQLHGSLFLLTLGLSGRFCEMPKLAIGGQADLVALVELSLYVAICPSSSR